MPPLPLTPSPAVPYSTALTSNEVARLTLDPCWMYDPLKWYDTNSLVNLGSQDYPEWHYHSGATQASMVHDRDRGQSVYDSTVANDHFIAIHDTYHTCVNPFTYAIWAKIMVYGNGDALCGDWSSTANGSMLYMDTDSVRLYMNGVQVDKAVPVDEWHHWCVVYNGTDVQLYVDGVYEGTAADTVVGDGHHYYVATYTDIDSASPNAYLDDFLFWDTALSSNEIYDVAVNDTLPPDEPLAHYPMSYALSPLHDYADNFDTSYAPVHWDGETATNYLVAAYRGDRTGVGNGQEIVEVRDYSGEDNHGTREALVSEPVWYGREDAYRGLYEFQVSYQSYIDMLDSVVSDPDWSGLGENITSCFFDRLAILKMYFKGRIL